MAAKNQLFQIDVITVDGVSLAIEHGTGELEGAAGFEHEVVPSATGDDFQKAKRVPRTLKANIQFGPSVTSDQYASAVEAQISLSQTMTGRRALLPKCSFAKMGTIGKGAVDVTWNLLAPVQWL